MISIFRKPVVGAGSDNNRVPQLTEDFCTAHKNPLPLLPIIIPTQIAIELIYEKNAERYP